MQVEAIQKPCKRWKHTHFPMQYLRQNKQMYTCTNAHNLNEQYVNNNICSSSGGTQEKEKTG